MRRYIWAQMWAREEHHGRRRRLEWCISEPRITSDCNKPPEPGTGACSRPGISTLRGNTNEVTSVSDSRPVRRSSPALKPHHLLDSLTAAPANQDNHKREGLDFLLRLETNWLTVGEASMGNISHLYRPASHRRGHWPSQALRELHPRA